MATKITRNDWDHITSERFDMADAMEVLRLKGILEKEAAQIGAVVTYCKDEEHVRYDGVVLPPEFSTCINVGFPEDHRFNSTWFCCTSATETTETNLRHCISFVREAARSYYQKLQEVA